MVSPIDDAADHVAGSLADASESLSKGPVVRNLEIPGAARDGESADSSDDDIETWINLERPELAEVLRSLGFTVPSDALAAAQSLAETTGADVGDLLIDGGHLTEAQWVQALSRRFDLPIAQVDIDAPDKTAIAQVGETLARKHQVLPFRVADDRVYIATSNPLDREMLDELIGAAEHLGLMVAGRRSIIRNIDREYDALASAEAAIVAFGLVDAEADQQAGITRATVDENAPVVQVVNRIVTQGVRNRASDVHIEALEDSVRVRYRIDGALSEAIRLPQRMASPIASRVKVLAELNIVERRRPQDGQFSLDVDGRPIDIRVSVVSTIHGEKVVMRLLDKAQNLISLDRLGMPPGLIDDYIKIVSAPVGMFLCTGPTGSGKTTTLYATLTEIQDDSKNVVTIEDPVEYEFRGINQMQVHEAGGFTFAEGLRGTLRQDPDVILVGEIRNAETAQIAMQAALTGHLVLSSLHAVDAVAAVHRFIDMGIEPFLVASAINGVMGQRLLRRICSSCRTDYEPVESHREMVRMSVGAEPDVWFHGGGCNVCNHTGYHGRVGVYELLTLTDEIRNLIVERATHSAIRTVALRNGMRTMQAEAFGLVAEGVTTVDEVLRSVYAPMDELPAPTPGAAPPVDLGSMAATLSLAVSDAAIAINEGSMAVSEGIA